MKSALWIYAALAAPAHKKDSDSAWEWQTEPPLILEDDDLQLVWSRFAASPSPLPNLVHKRFSSLLQNLPSDFDSDFDYDYEYHYDTKAVAAARDVQDGSRHRRRLKHTIISKKRI